MRHMPDAMPVAQPVAMAAVSDPADYRKALSCFATGVTVVTTRWQDSDWGMTCNSFASVSLEPRLVLWSIRKAASSLEAFTQSGGFSVSVLSQPQQPLARQFATGDMAARFAGVDVVRQTSERLRLTQAVAWFDCSLHQLVDAGDHHIVIGQVQDFGWRDTAALGFWRSQFVEFQAQA
ncbi:MAG: flavin reductase family protein [Hydrogenophaga sp.]|jgi:flavin reductase (DIM6/NTAB) family NADH-FMN oxidoreductase RutF